MALLLFTSSTYFPTLGLQRLFRPPSDTWHTTSPITQISTVVCVVVFLPTSLSSEALPVFSCSCKTLEVTRKRPAASCVASNSASSAFGIFLISWVCAPLSSLMTSCRSWYPLHLGISLAQNQ